MNAWKKKRQKWLLRRCQLGNRPKKIRKPNKQRKKISKKQLNPAITRRIDNNQRPIVELKLPRIFSLTENAEETMDFFMGFADEIDSKEYGKNFFIDSSDVEYVTVDALIYLIAILQNDQHNITMRYSFRGNYPKNETANRVFNESGFNDYVRSRMRSIPRSTEKMRIVCGTGNKSETARDLCDFVIDRLNKTRKEIQPLQKVLIELMSNVYYHAYEKNTFMVKKWYLYAEHIDDYIRCIFVDTGQGIAKTVRKNFAEKLTELLGLGWDDSNLIRSAFNGDYRSSTNEKHRGNGLSSVRINVSNDLFFEFEVISGRGKCILAKNADKSEMIISNFENTLFGTLYSFTIR